VHYLVRAGERARELLACDDAATLYARAIEAAGPDGAAGSTVSGAGT
jgi:hypothetical protein